MELLSISSRPDEISKLTECVNDIKYWTTRNVLMKFG